MDEIPAVMSWSFLMFQPELARCCVAERFAFSISGKCFNEGCKVLRCRTACSSLRSCLTFLPCWESEPAKQSRTQGKAFHGDRDWLVRDHVGDLMTFHIETSGVVAASSCGPEVASQTFFRLASYGTAASDVVASSSNAWAV